MTPREAVLVVVLVVAYPLMQALAAVSRPPPEPYIEPWYVRMGGRP